jgi:uncharacterized protein (TIGR02284 family)
MNKEVSVSVLNTLIEINTDRIKSYETAVNETQEADLKILFSHFEQTSQRCKAELITEVNKLDERFSEMPESIHRKPHRAWLDFKGPFVIKDRMATLNSCEYLDRVAVHAYKDALEHNLDNLTAEQENILYAQHALIKANYEEVKTLRDMMSD